MAFMPNNPNNPSFDWNPLGLVYGATQPMRVSIYIYIYIYIYMHQPSLDFVQTINNELLGLQTFDFRLISIALPSQYMLQAQL
jgi:hypothetical protein